MNHAHFFKRKYVTAMTSRKNNIRQLDRTDCGAACLAYVAAHYGLHLPVTHIREVCGTDQQGSSLKGLLDAARHFGFEAGAFKSPERNPDDLMESPRPLIVHLRRTNGWLHFVVLEDQRGPRFKIWDPADGKRHRMSRDKLQQTWTGYVLVLAPGKGFTPGDHAVPLRGRIMALLRMHHREWVPALMGSLAYALAGLCTSLFLKIILDQVLPTQEFPRLFLIGSIMLVLVILSWITAYFRSLFVVRSGIRMDGGLVLSYVRHLFQLPFSFFNRRTAGELNARIGDAFRIRAFVSNRLLVLSISLLSLLLSSSLLFWFCWELALITFAFIPGFVLIHHLAEKSYRTLNRKAIESAAQFEATSLEAIARYSVAKLFGAEETFTKRIEQAYVRMASQLYRSGQKNTAFNTAAESLSRIQTWTVLAVGSNMVLQDRLSIGELVAVFSLIGFLTTPILSFIESTHAYTEARIAAERLFEIQELPVESSPGQFRISLEHFQHIRFHKVYFTYPGRLPLLEHFSCTFPRGKISLVTGRSGCGKSTMAALLLRLYTPQNGKIYVDDLDIQLFELQFWRSFVGIVPQQTELFQGTLLENLVPGQEFPDVRRVQELCRLLHLNTLLDSLPDDILTPIGENGHELSGGERQKIGLVRALYPDPSVLILDEASAHLDQTDARQWKEVLRSLADTGKCIIVISHDKTLEQWADQHWNMEELMRISEGGRLRT